MSATTGGGADSGADSGAGLEEVLHRLETTARDAYGWPSLRPGQAAPMAALVQGRDALVVMPTGSGKSAVYQVPALLRDGPTLVVGPLLSLQRDQVTALERHGATADRAAALNSELSPAQREQVLARFADGQLEFLFCAPEQLADDGVLAAVRAGSPSLVVIDEAHCVSSWGQSFRPDYLGLGAVVEALGHPPVAALTATASPPVRDDVVERLRLRDPLVVVAGFDRPEIDLAVRPAPGSPEDKRRAVLDEVARISRPLLVYVATQRATVDYAEQISALPDAGGGTVRVAAYHGGLPIAERTRVHQAWQADELDVVVATSAFGMGIDKPDVRAVVHADPPESLDSYLQEIGRAGRDGQPAEAVLVYRAEDLGLRRFFVSGTPQPTDLRTLVTLLDAAGPTGVPVRELAEAAHLGRQKVLRLLDLLQRTGSVEELPDRRLRLAAGVTGAREAARAAVALAERREAVERSRVELVRGYAEGPGCRRQVLLSSFGEVLPEPCGNCDRCEVGLAEDESWDQADSPYPVGGPVRHRGWGPGEVVRFEGDRVVVLFDSVGYKTLDLAAVRDHDLLESA